MINLNNITKISTVLCKCVIITLPKRFTGTSKKIINIGTKIGGIIMNETSPQISKVATIANVVEKSTTENSQKQLSLLKINEETESSVPSTLPSYKSTTFIKTGIDHIGSMPQVCTGGKAQEPLYLKEQKSEEFPEINNSPNTELSLVNILRDISNKRKQQIILEHQENDLIIENKVDVAVNEIRHIVKSDKVVPLMLSAPFKETKLYLPLSYPKKKIVSGLMPLTDYERVLLRENTEIGAEFRNLVNIVFCKVIYHFAARNYSTLQECLQQGFQDIFGNFESLTLSKQLHNIFGEKIMTLIQHFIVIFWNNRTFDYKHLKVFAKNIDVSSYEGFDITPLTFIEATFSNKFLNLLSKVSETKKTVFLVNAENSSVLPFYYNNVISMERTGQKNADLLITIECKNEILVLYYDVKSYITMSLETCRFSLFHKNDKLLIRLINDIKVSFDKYIKDYANEKDHILNKYAEFLEIRAMKKKLTTYQRFQKIIELLGTLIGDPRYYDLKIAISLDSGIDKTFDEFYAAKIKTILKQNPVSSDNKLLDLFPKDNILDSEKVHEGLKETISISFPNELQKIILNNYENMIQKTIQQ